MISFSRHHATFYLDKSDFQGGFQYLLVAMVLGLIGCATSSGSHRWTGKLARTYDAEVNEVVERTSETVRSIGMGVESRQVDEKTYVVEATKKSGNSFNGRHVQLTGMSIYVRSMGDAGANLQIRVPEQNTSYASRRNDSYARQQARRILEQLDQQFSKSEMVQ